MEVIELADEQMIRQIVTDVNYPDRLVVIDCSAVWCGPCKVFGRFYHNFVNKHTVTDEIIYCKLDVDSVSDFCNANKIRSLPTILFIRNGEVMDRMVGANVDKFKSILQKSIQ